MVSPRKKSALNLRAVNALERLRNEGPHRGITYPQIAAGSGLSLTTVQRVFLNETEVTFERFKLIADALGVDKLDRDRIITEIFS